MYDFQKRIIFIQKWILNLPDLPQSQSPETVPICIVYQYFPHDNIVCIHKYDEFFEINRFRRLSQALSILRLIVHACFLTIEYQVFQFVPKYKHFRTI